MCDKKEYYKSLLILGYGIIAYALICTEIKLPEVPKVECSVIHTMKAFHEGRCEK